MCSRMGLGMELDIAAQCFCSVQLGEHYIVLHSRQKELIQSCDINALLNYDVVS